MGPLIIISGPSGTGKSTIVRRLLAASDLPLRLSVSATTRARRSGEENGTHYFFWTREQFETAVAAGQFLEWAEVFGQLYGTLRSEVDKYRRQGLGVVLEIDVQGAAQIRQQYPDAESIFIKAPSPAEYERRLRKRRTENETTLQQRLREAQREELEADKYQYQIINDDLERAYQEVHDLIQTFFAGDIHAG